MIDREKVIKGLEIQLEDLKKYADNDQPLSLTQEQAQEIIFLLKQQEAVEPMRVEIEQAGPLYHRCYCLKCGHHVGNMIQNKVTDVHENFCSNCGQKVKWE